MKRALAIFAKTPQPGLVKTRLTPPLSPEEGAELYRCMLLDTVRRVSSLGIDTVIFYDGDERFFHEALPGTPIYPQQGEDLGTRLEQAFSLLQSLGYQGRTVIGTDAPDLPLSFISESFNLMDGGNDVVYGPAEDGGYYLVAVKGAYGTIFRDIPWSGPEVLETSLERARESQLAVALLPHWYDVDGYHDLSRPGLSDPANDAPLTREFIRNLDVSALQTAAAV